MGTAEFDFAPLALFMLALGGLVMLMVSTIKPKRDGNKDDTGVAFVRSGQYCRCEDAPFLFCPIHPDRVVEIRAYMTPTRGDSYIFYLPSGFDGKVIMVEEDPTGAECKYVDRKTVQVPGDV